ncbi:RNA dependent RNA polymerase RdRp [Pterostylis amalgavirus 1]|nr:RNA dependent RNA polymerase RdRp [Pterostylis amalgavirus 1]
MAPRIVRSILSPAPSSDHLSKEIAAGLQKYRNAGLRFKDISYPNFLSLSLTYEDVQKVFRYLDGYLNQGILLALLTQAEVHGILSSKAALEPKDLVELYEWLRSDEGVIATRKVQTERKLLKSVGDKYTAREVAYSRLLEQQKIDYSVFLKEKRATMERNIADYMTLIQKEREEFEKEEAKCKARYPAVAGFPSMKLRKLRELCWTKYLDACEADGIEPNPRNTANLNAATDQYRSVVAQETIHEYCQDAAIRKSLLKYGRKRIKLLVTSKKRKEAQRFVASSRPLLERYLLRLPLRRRNLVMHLIPMGRIKKDPSLLTCSRLKLEGMSKTVLSRRTVGSRTKALLPRGAEMGASPVPLLLQNTRVNILRSVGSIPRNQIAVARSKWEAGVRRIIGGGELRHWATDCMMYRGGGNLFDAIRIFATADVSQSFTKLRDLLSIEGARQVLMLPSGLGVPDGAHVCYMRNFNDDATAGPTLRAYGLRTKYGLKRLIEDYCWWWFDQVGNGNIELDRLPYLLSRVGYRSKLLTCSEAFEKMMEGNPLGRAIMMLDAVEQSFVSPLYNALSPYISKLHNDTRSGWRNYLIRASSDWGKLWKEVESAACIIELDWSKFDRERPDDDISFLIDVFCSCFTAKDVRERRLLDAYRSMLRRSLLVKLLMMDDGGCFQFDGMIPSGSLWTGVLGTGLNILYITCALQSMGVRLSSFTPKCAGDDNLTLFHQRFKVGKLLELRSVLNTMFRAGIKEEDFLVHYPPYHVTTEQAVFPKGTDLSLGTSKILHKAVWTEFDGTLDISERRGRSHRWRYNFYRKPKFLANYFLSDGRSIRPAKDNLEKLLWPEGIHKKITDYEAALMSMVVDNPWNHHNVNHLMHRYCIVQQIKRQAFDLDPGEVIQLSGMKESPDGIVAYPMIGYWRRGPGKVHMEQVSELRPYINTFKDFISTVTTLYSRASTGGIDAWQFMSIVRGERGLGTGQFGNDILAWCAFLGEHPLSRELRPARRFREAAEPAPASEDSIAAFLEMEKEMKIFYLAGGIRGPSDVVNFVGKKLYQNFHGVMPGM